ncbi:MAG: helix-turn-helix transcriptional regulator [Prevotella sp.]|nr:helix-turn-helix transcriptional regulator [Prevotella sp.]
MRRALHLIILYSLLALAGCSSGGSADRKDLREQANDLYNGQQYEEALRLYEQALSRADSTDRLQVRQDIIDCYQVLGNQTKARELLKVQLDEAHAVGDQEMEAEALLTLGMQVYDTGDKSLGYDYMTQAVSLMEQSKASDAPYLLAYYHFVLMKRRTSDNDYPLAISHAKAVDYYLARSEEPEKGEQMLVRSLATMAFLYSETDSLAKADSIYNVWQKHLPIPVASERDICPYLTSRGHYQEVVDIQQRYVNWVREKKGELTASERTSKYSMAEAEAALGHGDRAYQLMRESYEINDTLLARQAEENAQELEAVYQNHQKTEQISRLRLWVIILGGLLALLVVVALVIRMRRLRKRMRRTIINVAKNLTPPNDDTEAARFAAFDRTVEQGRLYTQSDLTREMLCDLMGVDRTTFSRIIREQSGCQNMNDYLNQKRLRYAEQLLRQHPNYTIHAIMQDSGFQSKSTFTTLFKKTYGVTPSQYREQSE